MGVSDEIDRIPSTTLAAIRGILVKSLSRENLSITDKAQLIKCQQKVYYSDYNDGKRVDFRK